MKMNNTVKSILTFKFEMLAVLVIAVGTTGFSSVPSETSPTENKINESKTSITQVETPKTLKTATRYFSVKYDVPLIPQQTGVSCWAAGAAMLVGWRDKVSMNPLEIARVTRHLQQYYRNGLHPEDSSIFPKWGMISRSPQTYSVRGFKRLLETYGPLWVASAEPGPHIRVVVGMSGDGTPDGTFVHINDPWEIGMKRFRIPNRGSQYAETYSEFVRKQSELAHSESNFSRAIYVAHLRR